MYTMYNMFSIICLSGITYFCWGGPHDEGLRPRPGWTRTCIDWRQSSVCFVSEVWWHHPPAQDKRQLAVLNDKCRARCVIVAGYLKIMMFPVQIQVQLCLVEATAPIICLTGVFLHCLHINSSPRLIPYVHTSKFTFWHWNARPGTCCTCSHLFVSSTDSVSSSTASCKRPVTIGWTGVCSVSGVSHVSSIENKFVVSKCMLMKIAHEILRLKLSWC